MPPYRAIGYEGVLLDWPWCPRWFVSRLEGKEWGSDATIEGVPAVIYLQKAYAFWSKGMLSDLIEPPWTVALVDLLLFYDQLEKEHDKKQIRASNAEWDRLKDSLQR